jgi:peptidoglycan-associated lipoprotein
MTPTRWALWAAASTLAGTLLACGPDYPSCDTDSDCHANEVCVDGQCQQCRSDADCVSGQACNAGACAPVAPSCTSSAECGAGQECVGGRCTTVTASSSHENARDADPVCGTARVYFELDSAALRPTERDTLGEYARCPASASAERVVVTGMADPRGTEEYNLVLGERRAHAVKDYLERLGVRADAHSVGEEMATGTDEASFARDRAASLEAH